MGKVLVIILFLIGIPPAFAREAYYLDDNKNCSIKIFKNGQLSEVSGRAFANRPLEVKVLPKNPSMVAFKDDSQIYISPAFCMISKAADAKIAPATLDVDQELRSSSQKDAFLTKGHFIELDGGVFSISDKNQVSRDYNETFPSTTSNPTSWGQANKSAYQAGALLSVGLGFRQTAYRFFVIKIRSLAGKKTDRVVLTDINSGNGQAGDWVYTDAFLNFYGGYRFQFFPYSLWKPTLSGYLGISKTASKLTDNSVTYNLSSIGLAFLSELGLERLMGQSFSINGSIGFEFLGARNLKFEDGENVQGIKTKMSYNNTYLSMGIKYYF